jgi:hypothetical protein
LDYNRHRFSQGEMSFSKKNKLERNMLTPENEQTEIMRRQSRYKPPRSLSHWFIGRPLPTADAENETSGLAVGVGGFGSVAVCSRASGRGGVLVRV